MIPFFISPRCGLAKPLPARPLFAPWLFFTDHLGLHRMHRSAAPLADGYSRNLVHTQALYESNKPIALVVVGEAPGAEEDQAHRPFVGRSGKLLRGAYIDHWKFQDLADVYLTNAVRSRPPGNRTPKPGEIRKHWPYLVADLTALAGSYESIYVLAVGATACKAFGMKSLADSFKQQGSYVTLGQLDLRFFATWHPAYVLRDPSVGTSLESHLACMKRSLLGQDSGPLTSVIDASVLIAPSRIPGRASVCSLDLETYGCLAGREQTQFHPVKSVHWDHVRPRDAIVSCALTWRIGTERQSAFYNLTLDAHRRALVSVLRQVQSDGTTLLLQNSTFDLTFLRAFLPTSRPYLDPPTRLADLMVSSYLVDESRPERSLKALAPLLIGQRGLYQDEWRSLNFSGPNDPQLVGYNVADTERTDECHQICRKSYSQMYGANTGKGSEYSDRWYSNLLHLITWMSESGVPINRAALSSLDAHLMARKVRIERLATSVLDLTLEGKGSDKSKRGAIEFALSLCPPSVGERIELTKTGKVPYDDETRKIIRPVLVASPATPEGTNREAHIVGVSVDVGATPVQLGPVCSNVLLLRRSRLRTARRLLNVIGRHQEVAKLLSTYTAPMLRGRKRGLAWDNSPRVVNGRVYPIWFPVPREFASESGGTKQGRLAAKGPSVPTFPKIIKNLLTVDIWADYSQIELRVAALLSNDPVMVQEYLGSPDLHTRTARLMFTDKFVDDFISSHGLKAWKESVYRQCGKAINFLMLYRGGAEKYRETVLSWTGIDLPLPECYAGIDRFWGVYRGLKVWQDGLIASARKHGYYELPLTGQSRLFVRSDLPVNEVCNFPIQTVAANVTLSAQYTLWNLAHERNMGVTCPVNIYDAIGVVLREPERRRFGTTRALSLLAEVLPNPPYYEDLCAHFGRTLPLAYDVSHA